MLKLSKIMEDIKYGKYLGGEIFVEKAREVLKDFIHTRESLERLLFLLKIKYGSRHASSK